MLPRIVHDLTWNQTANVNGGRGKCIPIDQCNEHFNCSSKVTCGILYDLECTGVTHYSLGFLIGTQGWMLPRIVHDLTWNRTVDVNGGRGKCIPLGRCNKHFNCSSKVTGMILFNLQNVRKEMRKEYEEESTQQQEMMAIGSDREEAVEDDDDEEEGELSRRQLHLTDRSGSISVYM
eukprot:XP_011668091.1 PREDICTED: uncharacterized protein LOC105440059 [Strongylocentrotus purpuratus]